MKIHSGIKTWSIPAVLGVASFFALVAWTDTTQLPGGEASRFQDTIPTEKRSSDSRKSPARDLDRELEQMEKAKEQLENMPNIDIEKIQRDVEASIKNIDLQKMQLELQTALQQINLEKMEKDIELAMSKVDLTKLEKDIELAMKEVREIDKEAIKAELQQAREEMKKSLNSEEFKRSIQEAKKIDMKKIAEDMEEAKKEMSELKIKLDKDKINLKEEMSNAKVELEKAKAELKGYQEMIYLMEADDLLSTKEDYIIRYSHGKLEVNGKPLNESNGNKYSKYFSGKKETITISKKDGEISINNND